VGGDFWTIENPDVRVRGEFTAEVGAKPEVTLAARLVADPPPTAVTEPGDLAAALAVHAARSVAAFQPITLQGQLDTGESVTLLTAHEYEGRYGGNPRYEADVAVLGDYVAGVDQLYSAVRFRVDHPWRLTHLADGESSVVEDDRSTLSVEASDEGNWLLYESSAPATLRQLEIRVVSGCLVLVQLALDQDVAIRETQVRVAPDRPWLTVRGRAFCAEIGVLKLETLLRHEELTVERFANWIALNDRLDGLAWGVARPVEGVLQVQAQVVTSLVEGLHRRLPYAQSKFPDASRGSLDRVKQAARRAAADKAEAEQNLDPQQIRKAVKNSVAHMEDVDYAQRAEVVVAKVCSVVPEISESVADLPARLSNVRNDFAHQLPQDEAKEPLEVRYRRWLVAARVTPWLLRGLLLLHAGIEPQALRNGYLQYELFAFYRANTAQLVRELGWELPSDQPAPQDYA
jgi:hypothetical protein